MPARGTRFLTDFRTRALAQADLSLILVLLGTHRPFADRHRCLLGKPDNKYLKSGSGAVFGSLQHQIDDVFFEVRRSRDRPHSHARPEGEDAERLKTLARNILRARRMRARHLPKAMFGEPAWEMLLALYVADRSESRLTISRLTKESSAPATTSLRWLVFLERCKLVQRRDNPLDKRAVFIELTDLGRTAIEGYLTAAEP